MDVSDLIYELGKLPEIFEVMFEDPDNACRWFEINGFHIENDKVILNCYRT